MGMGRPGHPQRHPGRRPGGSVQQAGGLEPGTQRLGGSATGRARRDGSIPGESGRRAAPLGVPTPYLRALYRARGTLGAS
jgi:hypothetical protein